MRSDHQQLNGCPLQGADLVSSWNQTMWKSGFGSHGADNPVRAGFISKICPLIVCGSWVKQRLSPVRNCAASKVANAQERSQCLSPGPEDRHGHT